MIKEEICVTDWTLRCDSDDRHLDLDIWIFLEQLFASLMDGRSRIDGVINEKNRSFIAKFSYVVRKVIRQPDFASTDQYLVLASPLVDSAFENTKDITKP